MPKLGAGQYNAEISAILSSGAEIVHSSFWGGDLEALILQGAPRNLFKNATVILTAGETATHRQAGQLPDGTIIGHAARTACSRPTTRTTLGSVIASRRNTRPRQAIPPITWFRTLLAAKAAYEKAQGGDAAKVPSGDEVAKALTGLTFEGPSGTVKMNLGKGHQATQEVFTAPQRRRW